LPCKPSRYSELNDEKDNKYFIVGVNHNMTNQALYSSLTAYNYPKLAPGLLTGLGYTVMEDLDLSGSAEKYIGGESPAGPYIYVVEVARDCS
jgi:hypothetical protein